MMCGGFFLTLLYRDSAGKAAVLIGIIPLGTQEVAISILILDDISLHLTFNPSTVVEWNRRGNCDLAAFWFEGSLEAKWGGPH